MALCSPLGTRKIQTTARPAKQRLRESSDALLVYPFFFSHISFIVGTAG